MKLRNHSVRSYDEFEWHVDNKLEYVRRNQFSSGGFYQWDIWDDDRKIWAIIKLAEITRELESLFYEWKSTNHENLPS